MVNKEIVRKRLNKLDEYLGILYRLRKYSFDAFVGTPDYRCNGKSSELGKLCLERLAED